MVKPHYFVRNDQSFFLTSDKPQDKYEVLPGGCYLVQYDMMTGFYLEKFDDFRLPKKVYGNHHKDAERILTTFQSRPTTTGVLLTGEKGSGKTLLTKIISIEAAKQGMPTLIINNPYRGDAFSSFLTNISQPCVLLFDEFEKVYDSEHQRSVLTLMDGVFQNNKLFLLTCNEKGKIDSHMMNRPGRMFYMMEYEGLDTTFITEYCEDNLNNKAHIDSVCALSDMFWRFNFDMLQAVVEEMNRYNEPASQALRMLNVKPDFKNIQTFTVTLTDKEGEKVPQYWFSEGSKEHLYRGNPMQGVTFYGDKRWDVKGNYKDEDEDEDKPNSNSEVILEFQPETVVKVDGRKGTYLFENNQGYKCLLTKKVAETYNYMKHL